MAKSFQNSFDVYIGFASERVNIRVLFPNISAGTTALYRGHVACELRVERPCCRGNNSMLQNIKQAIDVYEFCDTSYVEESDMEFGSWESVSLYEGR
jgi:hypothetical protein